MSVTLDLSRKLRRDGFLDDFVRMLLKIKNILINSNVTEDHKLKLNLFFKWGSRFSAAVQILKSLDLPDVVVFEDLTDLQKTALLSYAKELLLFEQEHEKKKVCNYY